MIHTVAHDLTAQTWHITGCGRMGTLAAAYLRAAGWPVVVIRPGAADRREVRLRFADGRPDGVLSLPVRPPDDCGPVARLVVACKTPYTATAVAPIPLTEDALVLRLQNGIGSLDGCLGPGMRQIEVVTASAVKSDTPGTLDVVAENATYFGGGVAPEPWRRLSAHWPHAQWHDDIRTAQWRKLVVNAVLNPLTALHDVANGALVEQDTLVSAGRALAAEADFILSTLDPDWPGHSWDIVADVARATAGNTSSMRADLQAGARTEIEAINGWLVARGEACGLRAPAHREIAARVRARHPAS